MLALIMAGTGVHVLAEPDFIAVARFSEAVPGDALPHDWNPLEFKKIKRHTHYTLEQDEGSVVLKAVSEQSASGLATQVKIDPREFPLIDWQWKVDNILSQGDASKKEGDDYPARIYLTFEYDGSRVGFFGRIKYKALRSLLGRHPPLGVVSYI